MGSLSLKAPKQNPSDSGGENCTKWAIQDKDKTENGGSFTPRGLRVRPPIKIHLKVGERIFIKGPCRIIRKMKMRGLSLKTPRGLRVRLPNKKSLRILK